MNDFNSKALELLKNLNSFGKEKKMVAVQNKQFTNLKN